MNNDGFVDLIGASATGAEVDVSLGNGDGTFQSAKQSYAGQTPVMLSVADFNHDGRLDVAVSGLCYYLVRLRL